MYLSCDRRDVSWERLDVCRKKFLYSSVLKYFVDYRMLVCKSIQRVLVSRVAAASALWLHLRIELHLLEKQDADLFRRHYVQRRLIRHLPDPLLYFIHLRCECGCIFPELHLVDLHSLHLHLRKDSEQRLFHCFIKSAQIRILHLLPYRIAQQQSRCSFRESVRSIGCIFRGIVEKRK